MFNTIIGTCSICGGKVTRDFQDQHPVCADCGAKAVNRYGPRIPMVAPAKEAPATQEPLQKTATLSVGEVHQMFQKEG